MMKSEIVWFEVMGQNADKLRSFYGELFGWTFEDGPNNYGLLSCEQTKTGGGVGQVPQGSGWSTFYINVADVEKSLALAQKMGGEILMPVTELPTVSIAVFKDPEGHPVGLAQSKAA